MNIENYSKTWINMNTGTDLDITKYMQYKKHIGNISSKACTLDIGPGNGEFSYFLRKTYSLKANNQYMIDLSSSIINQLKSNKYFIGCTILHGDTINILEKNEKKFDLIILRHVMEHMERKYISDLIPLLMERLTNDGKIIVEVPNMGNIPFGIYLMYGDFSHVTGFTEKSLAEAFIWNGGDNIKIQTYNLIGNVIINKGIKKMILDCIAKFAEIVSIILSFLSFRIFGSYYGLNRVYSSVILLTVQKEII